MTKSILKMQSIKIVLKHFIETLRTVTYAYMHHLFKSKRSFIFIALQQSIIFYDWAVFQKFVQRLRMEGSNYSSSSFCLGAFKGRVIEYNVPDQHLDHSNVSGCIFSWPTTSISILQSPKTQAMGFDYGDGLNTWIWNPQYIFAKLCPSLKLIWCLPTSIVLI